jgi:hypothetical protein
MAEDHSADGMLAVTELAKTHRKTNARFWRELARLITFFAMHSPRTFLQIESANSFRKKRARQESNLRPSA